MRGIRLGQGLLRQPSGLLAITSTPSAPALSTAARVPLIRASSTSLLAAHQTTGSLPSIRAFSISFPRPKKRNAKSAANEAQEEDPNDMTPKKGWRAKKAREATAFAAGTAPSKSSKGGGGQAAEAAEDEDPDDADPNAPKHPRANPNNPLEFPDVESRFARAHERYSGLLRKLRSGQTSIAVEDIGAVRVKPDPKGQPGVTYPLRELAVVVPKGGRLVSILCHEASYVKPILSGVQNSEMFNQQPQRNPDNELELTMKVVRESREETAKRIRDGAHAYREVVRRARGRREKQHVTWVRSGEWGVDLRFRADKELEKKVAKKNLEIDKLEQQALKALASQPDD